MWLPETSVNLETLSVLAEHGERFTVLAPHQAGRVRRLGEAHWHDVSGARIDTTRPYLVLLPEGRHLAVFFYDGPMSRAVAFERLLSNGEKFVGRLLGAFAEHPGWDQLVHIATDGETYGHHHRFGDMALAWALNHVEHSRQARLTNYGEFLAIHPPAFEVEILENTSWSCAHGVERWRSHCGCRTEAHPTWRQDWRAPLREALDALRDAARHAEGEGAAAAAHLPLCQLMLGMALQPGVEDMGDFRVGLQEAGHRKAVAVVGLHAQGEGFHDGVPDVLPVLKETPPRLGLWYVTGNHDPRDQDTRPRCDPVGARGHGQRHTVAAARRRCTPRRSRRTRPFRGGGRG